MVRTQSQVSSRPLGIDTSRVLAMSTAVALHLLAGGLLLIPLSQRAIPQQTAPKERWLLPVSIPTPPPIVFPVNVTFTPKTHPPTKTLPVPVQAAVITQEPVVDSAVFAVPATISDVAAESAPTTTTPSGPIEAGQLQYLSSPAPTYPAAALRAGQQGTVMLRVLVGTDGRPAEVSVQTSSGHRALDLAARSQVLRSWRFQPAMQNGQAAGLWSGAGKLLVALVATRCGGLQLQPPHRYDAAQTNDNCPPSHYERVRSGRQQSATSPQHLFE